MYFKLKSTIEVTPASVSRLSLTLAAVIVSILLLPMQKKLLSNQCLFLVCCNGCLCIFSNSTKRWKVVSERLQNLSLKMVCDTRWESSSLNAVRYQYAEVKKALEDEYEQSTDLVASSEAESLLVYLEKVRVLNGVSHMSVISETMDLSEATKIMNKCVTFSKELQKYRFHF